MKKMLLTALCAASITCACATITPPSVSAIDRAPEAHDRIAESAELMLPFVSPESAARIRLAMALIERGLLAARYAATEAERLAALKQAEAATAAISTAARASARLPPLPERPNTFEVRQDLPRQQAGLNDARP